MDNLYNHLNSPLSSKTHCHSCLATARVYKRSAIKGAKKTPRISVFLFALLLNAARPCALSVNHLTCYHGVKKLFFLERWQVLMASIKYQGSLYRLVMVKRKIKTVYFVNCFNSVGFSGSVPFSTLCGAYKYFSQFKSVKKNKSFNNPNQVSLW